MPASVLEDLKRIIEDFPGESPLELRIGPRSCASARATACGAQRVAQGRARPPARTGAPLALAPA